MSGLIAKITGKFCHILQKCVYLVNILSTELPCTPSYHFWSQDFSSLDTSNFQQKRPFFAHCFYYFMGTRAVKLQFPFLMKRNSLLSDEHFELVCADVISAESCVYRSLVTCQFVSDIEIGASSSSQFQYLTFKSISGGGGHQFVTYTKKTLRQQSIWLSLCSLSQEIKICRKVFHQTGPPNRQTLQEMR